MAAQNSPLQAQPQLNPDQWADWRWRLSNLYWILDEHGHEIPFRPNGVQLAFLERFWFLNVILKARQLGFTTLIDLLGLDLCVFNSNQTAGIIAHTLEDSKKIFRQKIDYPYKKLPDQIKDAVPLVSDTAMALIFGNGSSISVGTSMRGGTLQFLHVSEFGKIAVKYPEKAREIVTGAFNTVHPGQSIFVESTAEGRGGYFFDMTQKARKLEAAIAAGTSRLTQFDFKFHFFPWFLNPEYAMDPRGIRLTAEDEEYFDRLEVYDGITLTPAQKAWYVKKRDQLTLEGKDDLDMKREFPSTPEEAFQVAIEGTYYGKQMFDARKQGRIGKVPHVPTEPTNTFWDLGYNDINAIWFHQYIANNHRFHDYYQNEGEALSHYARELQKRGYLYGKHYLPHDAEVTDLGTGKTRVDILVELGIPRERIIVVPRVEDVTIGIEETRKILPVCWFDESKCDTGIRGLESYRKKYNETLGTFMQEPLHDWASNPADAFRQFGQGWAPEGRKASKKGRSRNWRTA